MDGVHGSSEHRHRCAWFEQQCRERGLRLTPQRMAVYRTLSSDVGHPTADVLHARLRDDLPTLSLATVYRILESFVTEGLVRRVSTTDGAGRFDANLVPHHHLACRSCGSLTDVDDDGLARSLSLASASEAGFTVESVDVRLVGVCSACRTG